MDWILLRSLVLLDHLAVLINPQRAGGLLQLLDLRRHGI